MAKTGLRVGAHTSIAGGLHKALERGAAAGCDVIQVFTSSNQQWRTKTLTDEGIERWFRVRAETGVEPALAHDSYLINVASPDRALWRRSYRALAAEYERCALLSIPSLVMHPGAHLGRGVAAGIERIARAINRLHGEQPDNQTRILFENTAGQGTSIGHRFEHLRDLIAAVEEKRRIGVCIDTCHTLAAGYDIRTARGWQETFAELDRVVGCDQVGGFHVNDSRTPVGSRVDRHAHIGRGTLGLAAFRSLVNDGRFVGLPMVLETPKPSDHADRINLAALRALHGRERVTRRARLLAGQSLHRRPVT
jgi:deoxyribonuclease-4